MFNAHFHQCSVCKRSFLSDRLLSIHISEIHDSFFSVMAARRPSYVCLVAGCPTISISNDERRSHLREVHMFPLTYDFHEPAKYRRRGRKKNSVVSEAAHQITTNPTDVSNSNDTPSKTDGKRCKNSNKTEKYDRKKSSVRSSNSHCKDSNQMVLDNGDTIDHVPIVDMVDELSESFHLQAAISKVPEKISFGGRGRSRHNSSHDKRGATIG